MKETSYEDKLTRIINTYGASAQIDQCIEEMSELTKALIKFKRFNGIGQPLREEAEEEVLINSIAEEIADVQITIDELALGFGISDDIQDNYIPVKLSRTLKIIKDNAAEPVPEAEEEEEEVYFEFGKDEEPAS